MRSLLYIKTILAGVLLLSTMSCSTLNTKVGGLLNLDTDLTLTFLAEADVNPDDNKTPSPLFVRLYELKSPNMFNKANFIDIFERDAEVLGADMVSKQRLRHIRPGETRKTEFVLGKETKYVGLYAEFLQYKNAKYKIVIPVDQTNVISTSASIAISGNRLSVKE